MPEAFSVMTTWESLGALVYRGDLHSWFLQGLAVGRVRPYPQCRIRLRESPYVQVIKHEVSWRDRKRPVSCLI